LPARRTPGDLLPRVRGLRGLARPAQGRRPRVRPEAEGLPRLVHAPHLPPQPRPHLQPPGARGRRLDPRRTVQTRDRLPGVTRTPPCGVRTRGRWKAFSQPPAQPEGVVLTGPGNCTGPRGV